MNLFKRSKNHRQSTPPLTLADLRSKVDVDVHGVGFSGLEEAFRKLDAGELDGTPLEVELRMIRFLQKESERSVMK